MWCKYLLCNSFKALLVGSLDPRDWGQSLNEATILVLDTVGSILANLVNERDRIYRCPCFEEYHYVC